MERSAIRVAVPTQETSRIALRSVRATILSAWLAQLSAKSVGKVGASRA